MSATTLPGGISRLTSDSALVAPYHLETPLTTSPPSALIFSHSSSSLGAPRSAHFAGAWLLSVDEDLQGLQHLRRHVGAAEILLQIFERDAGIVSRLLGGARRIGLGQGGVGRAEGVELDRVGLALLGDGLKRADRMRPRVSPDHIDVRMPLEHVARDLQAHIGIDFAVESLHHLRVRILGDDVGESLVALIGRNLVRIPDDPGDDLGAAAHVLEDLLANLRPARDLIGADIYHEGAALSLEVVGGDDDVDREHGDPGLVQCADARAESFQVVSYPQALK